MCCQLRIYNRCTQQGTAHLPLVCRPNHYPPQPGFLGAIASGPHLGSCATLHATLQPVDQQTSRSKTKFWA